MSQIYGPTSGIAPIPDVADRIPGSPGRPDTSGASGLHGFAQIRHR